MKKKSKAEQLGISEYAYKKYLEKYDKDAPANIKRVKKEKANARKEWWAQNWIAFSALVVAVISLIISLLK